MPLRTNFTDLSYATEQEISMAVVSLHHHKQHPANYRVKSLIIRAGWAYFKGLLDREKGELQNV